MKLPVSNMQGAKQGDYELDDALLVFDKGTQALHDYVVAYRNNQRAGTASTKTKATVAGTGSKPWKQKGMGRARAGYRGSPIWRSGGVAFGPHPRDYTTRMNRKLVRLAFRRAFSDKVAGGAVKVLDELSMAEPKTKLFTELLRQLEVAAPALFVDESVNPQVRLAARNLQRIEVKSAMEVNAYDLTRYPTLVVSKAGMAKLQERLETGVKRASS
jgi:large subunit ribosomal protein L4